ncbi:MAG: hypothetical protein IPM89_03395 [Candidatus Competibacteraceae bacterium]|nr:MAG: hypothetical protein IPM89_03395 [Candidatus Competibacteraceae bacterium]
MSIQSVSHSRQKAHKSKSSRRQKAARLVGAEIKARGHVEKYRATGEPIHWIGVECSRESRTVVGFEVETR